MEQQNVMRAVKRSKRSSCAYSFLWGVACIGASLLVGCGADPVPKSNGLQDSLLKQVTSEGESSSISPDQLSEYEARRIFNAKDIVQAEFLTGDHHTVDEKVRTDGFTNLYTITSEYGTFEAHGDAMLPIRVHEIDVIATLRGLPLRTGYLGGMADAVTRPVRGAWDFVKDPVDTVTGIPQGGYRWYRRVKEMVKGGRGDLEDPLAKELVGMAQAKREWAYNLNVNPYTSNKILQAELNTVAWAAIAGNFTVTAATFPISGPASAAMTLSKTSKNMDTFLRDHSPEDLRKLNREKLEAMNVEESIIVKFLEHPWYSPRHETILVEALAHLNDVGNKGDFLNIATEAESEEEAFFFQRIAEMMRGYHELVSPVQEILVTNQIPLLYTKSQHLVFVVLLDYGWWSPETQIITKALTEFSPADKQIAKREIWVSGQFSSRGKEELDARGWTVEESGTEKLVTRRELEGKTFIYRDIED